MSQLPILYSFRRCPYAMRARMAIALSNIQCELREVSLKDKPQEMINISPKATVPVLLLKDGTVIDESINIMKWSFSLNDSLLILNEYLSKQKEMNDLILLFDTSFKDYLDRYKYSNRYEDNDPIKNRDLAAAILQNLEERINNNNFLYGDQISFVDMAILPIVRQFRIADERWFDNEMELPKVQKWHDHFMNSELFSVIMKKYHHWIKDSQVVYFPN